MKRTLYVALLLSLVGCADHWQNVAAKDRERILACQQAQSTGSSWGVFWDCGSASYNQLPPECLASEAAARSDKCAAIAKGEMLGNMFYAGAGAGVATGAAQVGAATAAP